MEPDTPQRSVASSAVGDTAYHSYASTPNRSTALDTTIGASSNESGIVYFCINASAKCVGLCCTPKQIVVIMRLLKAFTFSFLVLNVCSEFMYIFFVTFMDVEDQQTKSEGAVRDSIIRLYGIAMAVIAAAIELDIEMFSRTYFSGFKPYIPRSFLLFFIATISHAHRYDVGGNEQKGQQNDDYIYDDDTTSGAVPGSAVVFDIVTSMVLYVCSVSYFLLGALCCDRFTQKARTPQTDPRSTEIPASVIIGGQMGEPTTPYNGV
uniref:Uncharacterized protein n=1 Tax=Leptocylindrus danicus TaxID=163516 RepID=A0A7S2P617_9STRA|mmetsp:Transcript_24204/g.36294  ORF Transcript_24204/g.36294 Transcript_24204/m.36294 type:complete len:264 (+) Transcript_24204:110-901(+)|eukprot:CAMPEP_0116017176 /NCGR_PEP_ID=MMETSP0321-20121206/7899_1 /TAXON_ID=163516 /ORGANISM="Leptocylindrus danicus var. danicus, Strain B650" /LENGTH=263 /DNA_ID=CAMNT_0003487333 /DNA_START=54 /DNA_END=845 /DNA_ORIENTATION=+